MALTQQQKTDAYQFFIIAFGAAPGTEYLSQLDEAYSAGMTTKQIVNVYTTKPQFLALYPEALTTAEFANILVENVVGANASEAAKAEAKSDVIGALNAGWSKGDVVYQIFSNLASKPVTDTAWGQTSAMFANKVAVAAYVTETLKVSTTDLATLQAYVAPVTSAPESVTAAEAFAITADASTVNEGGMVIFNIANGVANTEYAIKLGGVQAADINGDLVRVVTTDAAGKASVEVAVVADSATEGAETLTASVLTKSATASVVINDTSVNTAPTVTAGQAFTINEGSAANAAVGTVAATDAERDAITGYAITSGNDAGLFAINATTGAITLTAAGAAALDAEGTVTSYTLGVAATDANKNVGTATAVTINVGDVSDTAPVAVAATAAATEAGAPVTGTLTATDADKVDAGKLVFAATGTAVAGLTINADGSYSFDPSQNPAAQALKYSDADLVLTADYSVTDSGKNVGTSTLAITVKPTPLTFTLVPSAAYVEEGQTITYKLVASEAVQEAVTGSIQVVPGDGTAGQTAAADFGSGALNPQNVTIAVGATESTPFNLIPQNDAATEVPESYTAKATVTGFTIADVTGQVRDPSTVGGVGQTFTLTTAINTIPGMIGSAGSTGTDGDDTIVALFDGAATSTLNALDSIDGGLGKNSMTLNVLGSAALGTAAGITISNVQTINARGDGNVVIDLASAAGITGVTALNSTLSANADLDAAATTDVGVSGATGAIDIDGGKNVTVSDATVNQGITIGANAVNAGTITVTDTKQGTGIIAINGGTTVGVTATTDATAGVAGGAINIGAATAATGAVTLVQNLNHNGEGANLVGGAITVKGGTSVNVTVNATTKAKNELSNNDIVNGAVAVTGNGKTTAVTVNQNASVTTSTKAAVAEVKDQTVVTFGALAANGTATVGGLTFTASKALTAEQVAAAFANLTALDTQSVTGPTANGVFTGALVAGYVSGAVSGKTVTFTAAAATGDTLALAGSVAPTKAFTAGTAAAAAVTSGNTVTSGMVTINDDATAAIKTITVNGYATGSTIGGAAATTVLDTLNLAGSVGTMTVADTADTLALSLAALGTSAADATLTLTAAPTTLNVTSNGNNYVNLTAAATKTLNVAGTGLLDLDATALAALETVKVTGTAGLKLNGGESATLTSVDTTGTTGTVTASISGTKATYTGGAGVDKVTVANAGTAITKAIDLGAGDDTLTLVGAPVIAPTVTLKGGDGTDTLSISTTSSDALDGDASFAAKLSGFERLLINDSAASAAVDLANLGFTSYVTTSGSAGTLTLNNLANNGTVVLTAAGSTTVGVKDAATGTADVLNVQALVSVADINFGTVTAANVETVNLTANDSDAVAANKATVILTADKATTVNLAGGANIDLTLNGSTAVTLVEGSAGYTGVLTFTAAQNSLVVKGGSGADALTANANDVALYGGAGNDTLTVTSGLRVNLYGGDGADKFVISAGASDALDSYTVINGVASGDTIQIAGANSFKSSKIALSVGADETLLNYANQAVNDLATGQMGWFQKDGNTFIVLDSGADSAAGFIADQDVVIMITGLVDLGTGASYNTTSNILEII